MKTQKKHKALADLSQEELWQLFPIVIQPYLEEYLQWYQEEKEVLLNVLREIPIRRIHHFGSTAVFQLDGKRTIDILIEVDKNASISALEAILIQSGWILMARNEHPSGLGLVFNKGYTLQGYDERVYHLHVRYYFDHDELYFRDYLNEHPEVATKYSLLKKELASQYRHQRDTYTEKKSEFISEYTKKARLLYGDRYK